MDNYFAPSVKRGERSVRGERTVRGERSVRGEAIKCHLRLHKATMQFHLDNYQQLYRL